MSDFEVVLARLLTEPGFATTLATNSVAALTGYRLSSEETATLTSNAGVVTPGPGEADATALGAAAEPLAAGLGTAPDATAAGFGSAPDATAAGFGTAPEPLKAGFGAAIGEPIPGADPVPPPPSPPDGRPVGLARKAEEPPLPENYPRRVDVDGDGTWDPHELRARADGGVDILADTDGDGQVEFVGHDDNADGLVDWSEYDTTGDGTLDTRTYDDDGDGWMDRSEPAS
jgi:hypothetical protein